MEPCNEVQEKIAGGRALRGEEQRHAAGCPRCAAVAASYSLLDATLEAFTSPVPDGFAERVMAQIAAEVDRGRGRWFERRPVQLVFAHAAALCAVFNVAWFVARVFAADVAFGGTP